MNKVILDYLVDNNSITCPVCKQKIRFDTDVVLLDDYTYTRVIPINGCNHLVSAYCHEGAGMIIARFEVGKKLILKDDNMVVHPNPIRLPDDIISMVQSKDFLAIINYILYKRLPAEVYHFHKIKEFDLSGVQAMFGYFKFFGKEYPVVMVDHKVTLYSSHGQYIEMGDGEFFRIVKMEEDE